MEFLLSSGSLRAGTGCCPHAPAPAPSPFFYRVFILVAGSVAPLSQDTGAAAVYIMWFYATTALGHFCLLSYRVFSWSQTKTFDGGLFSHISHYVNQRAIKENLSADGPLCPRRFLPLVVNPSLDASGVCREGRLALVMEVRLFCENTLAPPRCPTRALVTS